MTASAQLLFRRTWRVTVGDLQSDNLDIKFKIVRTLRSVPGTCELDIFGLTKAHRDEIHNARRPLVRVEAGYKDTGMSMLFQGDGRPSHVERDVADVVTKIKAGDGYYAIRTARAAQSFGPNTSLADVVRYIANAMGVGAGNVGTALTNVSLDQLGQTFPHGTVVRGPAARELTELLRSANMEWSIQDGVLQILERGRALQRQAVLLSSDTGMIEIPQVGKNNTVTVKALIQPDLVPGRVVRIQSDTVTGNYRIEHAEYTGDTLGDDWTAEMTTRLYQ